MFRDLLERGYLPKELPPPFRTVRFADAVCADKQWATGCRPKSAELCTHNQSRHGTLRRKLGLPNPVFYCQLSDRLADSWVTLEAHMKQSPYSSTLPTHTP